MKPMEVILGLAAAGGAYWLYSRNASTPVTPAVVPVASSAPPATSTAPGTGANNPPAAPAANTIKPAPPDFASLDPATGPNFSQWISNKLGAGRKSMSADEWNYWFSAFSGKPQTTDLFTPGDRGELINESVYIQRRTAAGTGKAVRGGVGSRRGGGGRRR